jgi:hypothetical protein
VVLEQPSAAAVHRPVPALLLARGLQPFAAAVGGAEVAAAACAAAAALPPARLHKAAGLGLYTEVWMHMTPPTQERKNKRRESKKRSAEAFLRCWRAHFLSFLIFVPALHS